MGVLGLDAVGDRAAGGVYGIRTVEAERRSGFRNDLCTVEDVQRFRQVMKVVEVNMEIRRDAASTLIRCSRSAMLELTVDSKRRPVADLAKELFAGLKGSKDPCGGELTYQSVLYDVFGYCSSIGRGRGTLRTGGVKDEYLPPTMTIPHNGINTQDAVTAY